MAFKIWILKQLLQTVSVIDATSVLLVYQFQLNATVAAASACFSLSLCLYLAQMRFSIPKLHAGRMRICQSEHGPRYVVISVVLWMRYGRRAHFHSFIIRHKMEINECTNNFSNICLQVSQRVRVLIIVAWVFHVPSWVCCCDSFEVKFVLVNDGKVLIPWSMRLPIPSTERSQSWPRKIGARWLVNRFAYAGRIRCEHFSFSFCARSIELTEFREQAQLMELSSNWHRH